MWWGRIGGGLTGSIQARHELVHERRNDDVWPGDPCARPGRILKGRKNIEKQSFCHPVQIPICGHGKRVGMQLSLSDSIK